MCYQKTYRSFRQQQTCEHGSSSSILGSLVWLGCPGNFSIFANHSFQCRNPWRTESREPEEDGYVFCGWGSTKGRSSLLNSRYSCVSSASPPPPHLSPFPCVVKVCFGKEKVITFQTPFLLSRGSREEGGERSNLSFFIIFSLPVTNFYVFRGITYENVYSSCEKYFTFYSTL